MKNIVLVALMLYGMILPTNVKAEMTSDSLSVLLWLDFKVNHKDGDIVNNDDGVKPYSLLYDVVGKLYTDGQMNLTFGNNEPIAVSINLDNVEVTNTEFVPAEGDRSLTFDLDDFGKGAYEVNVTMSDGSVQTATFEY